MYLFLKLLKNNSSDQNETRKKKKKCFKLIVKTIQATEQIQYRKGAFFRFVEWNQTVVMVMASAYANQTCGLVGKWSINVFNRMDSLFTSPIKIFGKIFKKYFIIPMKKIKKKTTGAMLNRSIRKKNVQHAGLRTGIL
tara:strand:- start:619 stop:1032 length:414 start_codon:yes stop_codon:yes gene_type:complete